MKLHSFLIFSLIFFIVRAPATAQPSRRPFPQHVTYFPGTILPTLTSRKEMDSRVGSFYFQWKSKYIRKSCDAGQYYVWFGEGKTQSVSEGQGYGMVILSLMGGYDSLAHEMYDGLFRYCQAHPSTSQAALMPGRKPPTAKTWKEVQLPMVILISPIRSCSPMNNGAAWVPLITWQKQK